MNSNISLEQIKEFSNIYNSDKNNKLIENMITKNGLENSCMNKDIITENQPVFNIELQDGNRYDQKDNYKCWIYAGLNMVKHCIANNLNIDIKKFELSNNYIAFFDKLEKSNNIYEIIINLKQLDWDYIHNQEFLKNCVKEGGYWQWFSAIINKYGIVPLSYMSDVVESMKHQDIDMLYTEKIKKDIIYLLEEKKNNNDLNKLTKMKETFLQENYIFLSKILGEPTQKFNYEYKNKEGKYIRYDDITPLEFKNKFLSINLNDFVSIGNLPMYNKDYYKIYRLKYLQNVYEKSYVEFLNLPINNLKELAVKQLKDNIPVYMSANITKFRDKESGVLDKRLYNYKEILGLNTLTKEESLNTHDIYPHHCMVFTGVNIAYDKPQRWKLEDSYGTSQKVNGYYVMNDNFFDDFVLQIIVNKKYLSKKQLELLDQAPIEFDLKDPF